MILSMKFKQLPQLIYPIEFYTHLNKFTIEMKLHGTYGYL